MGSLGREAVGDGEPLAEVAGQEATPDVLGRSGMVASEINLYSVQAPSMPGAVASSALADPACLGIGDAVLRRRWRGGSAAQQSAAPPQNALPSPAVIRPVTIEPG